MKRIILMIIVLFAGFLIFASIWLSLDKSTRCRLIYGKNICNFYAMMDIAPSPASFDELMNLCRDMNDVPKKDSCFEYIAQTFIRINVSMAREACDSMKEFRGVHNKTYCYDSIDNLV